MDPLPYNRTLAAQRYNRDQVGKAWRPQALPWPLRTCPPWTPGFAELVARFQADHGLRVDGKLGPRTLEVLVGTSRVRCTQPSNRIIAGGQSLRVPDWLTRAATMTNFRDDAEVRFSAYPRTVPVTHLVLHETFTRTTAAAIRRLQERCERSRRDGRNFGRGFRHGVHLIVGPDGHVSQHADLLNDRLVHANQLNATSVGVAVVNPYTGGATLHPFTESVERRWWTWVPSRAPAMYTRPTDAQLRALEVLVPFLAELLPELPLRFPTAGLGARRRRIRDWSRGARPDPGVVAHRDMTDETDGRFPLEHLIETLLPAQQTAAG